MIVRRARVRRLLWFLTWFGVFFLIVGAIFISYLDYQVNLELGVYGTNVDANQGAKAYATPDGVWYYGFNVFEFSVHELMIASVLFGIIIGSLGMFGILRRWNKKTDVETKENRECNNARW